MDTNNLTVIWFISSAADDYKHGAEIRLNKSNKDLKSISDEVFKIDLNVNQANRLVWLVVDIWIIKLYFKSICKIKKPSIVKC